MGLKRLDADGAGRGGGVGGGLLWESGEKLQSEAGSSAALGAPGVGSEQGSQKSSCEAGRQKHCCLYATPGSSVAVKSMGSNPSATTVCKLCVLQ